MSSHGLLLERSPGELGKNRRPTGAPRFEVAHAVTQSVRGVNVMRVRDGLIIEALVYVKSGGASVATAVRSATNSSGVEKH